MLLSLYFIYHFSRLFYLYECTDRLFAMMIPYWALAMNLIIEILSLFISIKVYKQSISIVKGISITFALMAAGQIIILLAIN